LRGLTISYESCKADLSGILYQEMICSLDVLKAMMEEGGRKEGKERQEERGRGREEKGEGRVKIGVIE
jgi:hypothetical protein